MRTLLPALCLAGPLLAACEANCPAPTVLTDQTFEVIANPIEHLSGDNLDEFAAHPDYLSYGSPANGHSQWAIRWGQDTSGAVTVTIDGQSYEARGEWDGVECGNFALEFDGEHVAPDGTLHNFNASGVFVTYGGHLAGEMLWVQSWKATDARAGSWRARVGLRSAPQVDSDLAP